MSIANCRVEPVAAPYLLGSDGRLLPIDPKKDLRQRIRAVLRNPEIVAQVASGVEMRKDDQVPLWLAGFDAEDDSMDFKLTG